MGNRFSQAVSYVDSASSSLRTSRQSDTGKRLTREFSHITDNYKTLDQVKNALMKAGLESSNLIVGLDFTKSNEWTGKKSFNGKSLHAIDANIPNPYEQAISIIGRTLPYLDEDSMIPCFGFGDVSTHDRNVFSFFPDHRDCDGFEEALERYKELVLQVKLAGPTSFAPIIEAAIDIVVKNECQYHVLLIIADGQVTRSVDTESGRLSPQERSTIDAIVAASKFPLSIVLVGVGDGPWDMMEEFDDNIPDRDFDNFQFVNFTEIMSRGIPIQQREAAFALAALMEIPVQFRACVSLGLLNCRSDRVPVVNPLPPPVLRRSNGSSIWYPNSGSSNQQGYYNQRRMYEQGPQGNGDQQGYYDQSSTYEQPPQSKGDQQGYYNQRPTYEQPPQSNGDQQLCPVCWVHPKNMAFNCGHQTCQTCGDDLTLCPICRNEITTRLRLY